MKYSSQGTGLKSEENSTEDCILGRLIDQIRSQIGANTNVRLCHRVSPEKLKMKTVVRCLLACWLSQLGVGSGLLAQQADRLAPDLQATFALKIDLERIRNCDRLLKMGKDRQFCVDVVYEILHELVDNRDANLVGVKTMTALYRPPNPPQICRRRSR